VVGAGDRDRTGMTSLEGWGSTIELRPRGGVTAMRSLPVPGSGRCLPADRVGFGWLGGMWRSLVSAPALGAGGREFESPHPDQFLQIRGHIDLGEDHHRAARGSHLLLRRASGAARTGLQLALGVGRFPGAPGPTTTLARRRRLARGESAAITLASYAAAVAVLLTGSRTVRSPKSATRSRRPPRAST